MSEKQSAAGFSWGLTASEELAQKVFGHYAGVDFPHWGRAMARYREAKANLIAALDLATGRVAAAVATPDPSPEEAHESLTYATAALGFEDFAANTTRSEAKLDRLGETGYLLAAAKGAALRPGMKLGRAFGLYVQARCGGDVVGHYRRNVPLTASILKRWHKNNALKGREDRGPTDEEFLDLVTNELATLRDRGRRGAVVLSANVLDLVMMSEHAAYQTCHSLTGRHRAGCQQYLYDGHTAVAYYYQDERPYGPAGLALPYKTWRQLVHLDLKARVAHHMRVYAGATIPRAAKEALREAVAGAFAVHHGKDPSEPGWGPGDYLDDPPLARPVGKGDVNDKGGVCWVDVPGTLEKLVRPKSGGAAFDILPLAGRPPCLSCGADLKSSMLLLCDRCDANGKCAFCKQAVRPLGGGVPVPEEDLVVCRGCREKHYAVCAGCAEMGRKAAMVRADSQHYCPRCRDERLAVCDYRVGDACCPTWFPKGDAKKTPEGRTACPRCYAHTWGRCHLCHKLLKKSAVNTKARGGGAVSTCKLCRARLAEEEAAKKAKAAAALAEAKAAADALLRAAESAKAEGEWAATAQDGCRISTKGDVVIAWFPRPADITGENP